MIHTCAHCGLITVFYDSTSIQCCGDSTIVTHNKLPESPKLDLSNVIDFKEKLTNKLNYHYDSDESGYQSETTWDIMCQNYQRYFEVKPEFFVQLHIFTIQPWGNKNEIKEGIGLPVFGSLWGGTSGIRARYFKTISGSPPNAESDSTNFQSHTGGNFD